MNVFALWRRLDTPGHDAALLTANDGGFVLRGTAVFRHPAGPACVDYAVEVDAAWRTRRGKVCGFVADRRFDHTIAREAHGWSLDGVPIARLAHLLDLDFGFTPATNLLQLRRTAPGASLDLPVAWFDIDAITLVELPQRYERRDETTYWYAAPTVPYEGILELAPNGFARKYPQLWAMEG